MRTDAVLWTMSGSSLVLAIVAAVQERRRTRRRNIDKVGWVPWTLLQVIAVGVAAVTAGYALKM